jgi:hypothetical protein
MLYDFKVIGNLKDKDGNVLEIGTIIEVNIKMSEYDEFAAAYPQLERYIGTAPAVTYEGKTFGSGVETRQPDTFKEVLAKIGEAHPSSPLAARYRKNKTIKEIRTREVVDKHRKAGRKAAEKIRDMKKTKFAR